MKQTKEAGFDMCLPQVCAATIEGIILPNLDQRLINGLKQQQIYNDFRNIRQLSEEELLADILPLQEDRLSGHISEEEEQSVSS
mmetsp:Transcript_17115/g.26470  ORF Transcript_17115/g.26470 Transcript_17115/m.26470 type:complete len:84 (-) Transcript_17115:416-667(-)